MIIKSALKCNHFRIISNILDHSVAAAGGVLLLTQQKRYLLKSIKTKLLTTYDTKLRSYTNEKLKLEYSELIEKKNDVNNLSNQQFHARFAELEKIIAIYEQIEVKENEVDELGKFLEASAKKREKPEDEELVKLMEDDLRETRKSVEELKVNFIDTLVSNDSKEDSENATIELHAGVGGQEAMLFCKELFDMYRGYAAYRGWSFTQTSMGETDIGGFREATAEVSGSDVFKYLKFESGVHRVQRVPKTERTGRIHTSTVTVCILPRPAEIEIELNQKDLIIDNCRARGPGGQHVNKTESAIRVTHTPSGIVIFVQDERQNVKNRALALERLKLKLYQMEFNKRLTERERNRRLQVSSASRSERIRTYNYTQDRITDHRLDDNFHNINEFLLGTDTLNELIDALKYEQSLELIAEMLQQQK